MPSIPASVIGTMVAFSLKLRSASSVNPFLCKLLTQIIFNHPDMSNYVSIRKNLCCKTQAELDFFVDNVNVLNAK